MGTRTKITATGNAGFHVLAPEGSVFIDAFWDPAPRFLRGRRTPSLADLPADLILVTHSHWDHFSPERVVEAAARTGATVAAPQDVIDTLRRALPDTALVALEPPENVPGKPAASAVLNLPSGSVTAFRTSHGRRHNSYLIRLGPIAVFHDGDNEDTRPLDPQTLAPLDALLLCPWQGSDWVRFVERLAPRKWFLIHLSEDEIRDHRRGRFLNQLADRVPFPDRIVALRLGESLDLD